MENLLFSLNATIPIFLLMVVGYFLNKMNILEDALASKLNSFVFKVSLPLLLFVDVSKSNFKDLWDTKFVVFCVVATLIWEQSLSASASLPYICLCNARSGSGKGSPSVHPEDLVLHSRYSGSSGWDPCG